MEIIEWIPEYSVHVAEIDQEHRLMFDFVNRLHRAMLDGKGKDILKALLGDVVEYAESHFAREEKLMADIHYPGILDHAQEHSALIENVRLFVGRFDRGETTMTIEFSLFLAEWIKRQIMTIDRKLAEYTGALAPAAGEAPRLLE
jgi:hemerythrin